VASASLSRAKRGRRRPIELEVAESLRRRSQVARLFHSPPSVDRDEGHSSRIESERAVGQLRLTHYQVLWFTVVNWDYPQGMAVSTEDKFWQMHELIRTDIAAAVKSNYTYLTILKLKNSEPPIQAKISKFPEFWRSTGSRPVWEEGA